MDITGHDVAERARLLSHELYAGIIDADPSLAADARTMIGNAVANDGGTMGQRLWAHHFANLDWAGIRRKMLQDDEDGRLLRSNSPFSEIIGIRDVAARAAILQQAKADLAAARSGQSEASIRAPVPSAELKCLYERAWSDHGATCLWNVRRQDSPTPEHAAVVGGILKRRGNLDAMFLGHSLVMLANAA